MVAYVFVKHIKYRKGSDTEQDEVAGRLVIGAAGSGILFPKDFLLRTITTMQVTAESGTLYMGAHVFHPGTITAAAGQGTNNVVFQARTLGTKNGSLVASGSVLGFFLAHGH